MGLKVRLTADADKKFAGLVIEGGAPKKTQVPTSWVQRGIEEGWIEVEGGVRVVRPAGPPGDAYRDIHHFLHADFIVLKGVDGDIRYRVTHQPDKYHNGPAGTDAVGDLTARVDHFYELTLEG